MNSQYREQALDFLHRIFSEMKNMGIDFNFKEIDHLCFRTSSVSDYHQTCLDFLKFGRLLAESLIGGRMISTYKLSEPVVYEGYTISLVEVPAPKTGRDTVRGFEHIEVVVSDSFEELQHKYSHLKLVTHALSKKINPELEIEFDAGAIKFHHQSLERVIEWEKASEFDLE